MVISRGEDIDVQNGQLQPRHDLLSSAAMGLLAPISLGFIHSRAADALEGEIAKETAPTTLLWACADHRHRSGDRKGALSLALACAQHLLELGLSAEACRRLEESLAYCTSKEDRLAVLSRLAEAFQVQCEWEKTKQALRDCIALNLELGGDLHPDFEILLYQARYRSNLEFVTLLNDIMPCVESTTASPDHRLRAAVIALKIASDAGTSAMLDAIYAHIRPLLSLEGVDPVAQMETEIIYQTMRGEGEISLNVLHKFVALSRSLYGELAYSNALAAAATACRIDGRDSECLLFVNKALEHAVSNKLPARVRGILLSQLRLHVAAYDFAAARLVFSRLSRLEIPEDDQVLLAELRFCQARIALEDKSVSEVERAVDAVQIVPESYSISRRAACLALVLRLRLLQRRDRDVLIPLIRELEAIHLCNRDIGSQDFEAYALGLGLRAVGEEAHADQLLKEYVHSYRRSRRPLTPDLQRLVYSSERLTLHKGTDTTEALSATLGESFR